MIAVSVLRGVIRVVAVVGTLAVLTVAGIVVLPATVGELPALSGLERTLEGFGREALLLGLSALLSLYLLVAVRSGSDEASDERFDRLRETQPEAATATEMTVVGAALDDAAASGVETGGREYERTRARLRESAAEAYALAADVSSEQAEAVIDRGIWTDHGTAARFLRGAETSAWPLTARLRLWLDPGAERERRITATVAALAALEEEL